MAEQTYDPKASYYAIRRIKHAGQGRYYEAAKKDEQGNHIIEETFTLEHLQDWQVAYLVEGQKAVALVATVSSPSSSSGSTTKTKEAK
jgi:hypothetical protein